MSEGGQIERRETRGRFDIGTISRAAGRNPRSPEEIGAIAVFGEERLKAAIGRKFPQSVNRLFMRVLRRALNIIAGRGLSVSDFRGDERAASREEIIAEALSKE